MPGYGEALFRELGPLWTLQVLWYRQYEFHKPGGMQLYHLINRICAFVETRYDAQRKRRSKNNTTPDPRKPEEHELREHFGLDWKIVATIWPCARFLCALREASTGEEAHSLMTEVGELLRRFAAVHVPDREMKGSIREDLERTLSGLTHFAETRLRVNKSTARRELLAIVVEARDKILRTYIPSGDPERPRGYIRRTVRRAISDKPIEVNSEAGSIEFLDDDLHQTANLVAASSYRKRRELAPDEMLRDIDRGRQRQRHRDPDGNWLTVGQCVEVLTNLYDVSRRTVYNEVRRLVEAGKITPRETSKELPGAIPASSLRVLEQHIAQRFSRKSVNSADE
jgi:hypothetical protein